MTQTDTATDIKGGANYADRDEADKIQHNRRVYDSAIGTLQQQVALLSDQMATITDFVEFWNEAQGTFRMAKRLFVPLAAIAGACASVAVVFGTVWAYFHALEVRIKQ